MRGVFNSLLFVIVLLGVDAIAFVSPAYPYAMMFNASVSDNSNNKPVTFELWAAMESAQIGAIQPLGIDYSNGWWEFPALADTRLDDPFGGFITAPGGLYTGFQGIRKGETPLLFFNLSALASATSGKKAFLFDTLGEFVLRVDVSVNVTWKTNLPAAIELSVINSFEPRWMNLTLVSFFADLRPIDFFLLRQARLQAALFDQRASATATSTAMTLYRVHGGGDMTLTNRNLADPEGEWQFVSIFLPRRHYNTSFVTRFDNIIVDPRWRAYELCNGDQCDRASLFSPLGVGSKSPGSGLWYSFPDMGECEPVGSGLCTWSQRQVVNAKTIALPCLGSIIGNFTPSSPDFDAAWTKGWVTCPNVTAPLWEPTESSIIYAHA